MSYPITGWVAAGRWYSFSLRLYDLGPSVPVTAYGFHSQRGLRQHWRLGTQPKKLMKKKKKKKQTAELNALQPFLLLLCALVCAVFVRSFLLVFFLLTFPFRLTNVHPATPHTHTHTPGALYIFELIWIGSWKAIYYTQFNRNINYKQKKALAQSG